jgi:hypothetical protein
MDARNDSPDGWATWADLTPSDCEESW